MGVERIPVGGLTSKDEMTSRDWFDPFRVFFSIEPVAATRGRRTAVCTGASSYKAWDRTLYLTTVAGANQVFEIGSSQLIGIDGNGTSFGGIWNSPFYWEMTLNRSSGALANAAGDCCQGFGIGSMGRNTPWEGQVSNLDTVIHIRFNFARLRWELFAATTVDVGVSVPLSIQPITPVDLALPCIGMAWDPPDTMKIYFNGVLVHTQSMRVMLPGAEGIIAGGNDIDQLMFVSHGSNAAYFHTEAGFYTPRFYQKIMPQPLITSGVQT